MAKYGKAPLAITVAVAATATVGLMGDRARAAVTPRTTANPATPVTAAPTTTTGLKAAQSQARQDYAAAQQDVQRAQAAVTAAQEQSAAAGQSLTSAQASVQSAQVVANDRAATLQSAERSLTRTQAAAAQHATDLASAQTAVTAASTAVTTANSGVASAEATATSTAAQLNSAQAANTTAQDALSQASQAAATAQTAVDTAQAALDQARRANAGSLIPEQDRRIVFGPEWVAVAERATGKQAIGKGPLFNDLTTAGDAVFKDPQNQYVHIPALQQVPVQYNADGTLTPEEQLLLTRYYVELVNPIRAALGEPPLQITEQSLALGTKVAQMYSQDNWYAFEEVDGHLKGHYLHALAVNNGETESLESPDFYRPAKVPIPITTMDGLLAKVHHAVISFVFHDAPTDWSHMTDVAGLRAKASRGIFTSVQTDKYFQIHFNSEVDLDKKGWYSNGEKFSRTPDTSPRVDSAMPTTPVDLSQYESALTRAQAALTPLAQKQTAAQQQAADAAAKLATATAAAGQAQTALEQARTAQATAQQRLADAKAHLSQLEEGVPGLTAAQQAYDQARAAADQAQRVLQDTQADQARATSGATQAAAAVATAQQALTAAERALDQARARLLTDAQVYAGAVRLRPLADRWVGTSRPELTIANPAGADSTQPLVPGTLAPVPLGTRVAFTDPAAVDRMLETPGVKTAPVTIYFPDHSSLATSIQFRVLAADQGTGEQPITAPAPTTSIPNHQGSTSSRTTGAAVVASRQVSGHPFATASVPVMAGGPTTVASRVTTNSNARSTTSPARSTQQARLPQTGAPSAREALTLIGAGLMGLVAGLWRLARRRS